MNEQLNELMNDSKEENGIILNFARDFQSKEEMQSFYSDYGFVTLNNFIPSDLIENIVNDLRFIFEPFATDKSNPIDSGIIYLDKNDKKLLHNLHVASEKSSSIKLINWFFRDILREISGKNDPVFEVSICPVFVNSIINCELYFCNRSHNFITEINPGCITPKIKISKKIDQYFKISFQILTT